MGTLPHSLQLPLVAGIVEAALLEAYYFFKFDQMTFPSPSGPLRDIPNHVKKEFTKDLNISLSNGYQNVKDHEGEGDGHIF